MPEREGLASLENYLEKCLAEEEIQDWKCTGCSQYGSGVRKLGSRSCSRINHHPVKS